MGSVGDGWCARWTAGWIGSPGCPAGCKHSTQLYYYSLHMITISSNCVLVQKMIFPEISDFHRGSMDFEGFSRKMKKIDG